MTMPWIIVAYAVPITGENESAAEKKDTRKSRRWPQRTEGWSEFLSTAEDKRTSWVAFSERMLMRLNP